MAPHLVFLLNVATLSGFCIFIYTKLSPRSPVWKNRKELMNKRKKGMIHTDSLMEDANLQHINLKLKNKGGAVEPMGI